MDRTFITCAATGNLTRPDQTPRLPITLELKPDVCSLDLNTMSSGPDVVTGLRA